MSIQKVETKNENPQVINCGIASVINCSVAPAIKFFNCGIAPAHIEELGTNEIFVFGSNLQGLHDGGAARMARERFGAIMGQGVGLQGQSYAIPTMQDGIDTIKPYIDDFITFAKTHVNLHFIVTRVGCGIAGFRDEDIAPLFQEATSLTNVSLPKGFIDVLNEIGHILWELYTIAHHAFTRYYGMEKEFYEWIKSYPFPLNDLEAMKELRTNWIEFVYDSIEEILGLRKQEKEQK